MQNNEVENYYSQKFVQYLICNYIQNRTMDFIIPRDLAADEKRTGFRYRRCNNPTSLLYFFDKFEFLQKPFNLYASVANVGSEFPLMSFNREEESRQTDELNETGGNKFREYVTSYELKIDIDNSNLEIARDEGLKVYDLLKKEGAPFWLMFSGNKGFNFTIPAMPSNINVLELPDINLRVATRIKEVLGLSSIDLTVYTLNRVFKVPYSVERHENLIALPLEGRKDLETFRKEDFRINNVLKSVRLLNRGLLLKEGTQQAVNDFYVKYGKKTGMKARLMAGIQGFKEGFA